jgi:lysophospholipase L1-like esterase
LPGGRRHGCAVAWVAVACAAGLVAPLPAQATGTIAYAALGDSYTSSPFTGPSQNLFCAQSDNNYPQLVASAIQSTSLADVSCAGAVTENMTEPQTNGSGLGTNPPQFNALTPDTTLVTVGIGGNDIGLVDVALECFSLDLLSPTGSACQAQYTGGGVDQISAMIDAAAPKLAAVYQGIHARSPQARILAVGYPAVLPVDGTGCWPLTPLSPADVSWLASILVELDNTIATVAAANDVQYVDTYTPTIGYDVCQPIGHAGFTSLLPTSGISAPLHPNALGEQLMANAVINAIANPPTVAPAPPAKPVLADLKLTRVTVRRTGVTVTGTINPSYHGRVTVALRSRYRTRRIHLHRSARVNRGRWRTTIHIQPRYRGKLRSGTVTATSYRHDGLTASTAHVPL